jgi:hypothetical protein
LPDGEDTINVASIASVYKRRQRKKILPMMEPEYRIKGGGRNAAHMASVASKYAVIVVVQALERPVRSILVTLVGVGEDGVGVIRRPFNHV